MNQTLFTARVTDDVPPRLSVEFGKGNGFQKDGKPCSAKVTVNATRQIRVHLGNKTVVNEALGNLAAAQDCGRSLVLRHASQNSYDYVHDNEDSEGVNLSQVTLQIQGLNLMAKFEAGGTGPVAPVMPGAVPAVKAPESVQGVGGVNAPAPVAGVNPFASLGAQLQAQKNLPYKPSSMVPSNVPVPVPAVVAAPQPPVTPLRGDLPQEIWSNKRLVGTLYSSYQWYVNNPNRPSGGKDQADYDLLYPIFVKEERLYATLQEKLRAAAAHNTLSCCLPDSEVQNLGMEGLLYKSLRNNREAGTASLLLSSLSKKQCCLEAERNYLAQQARNEYNAAS